MTFQQGGVNSVWGIRAGVKGEAEFIFLKSHQLALGWKEVGDLQVLAPDREVFKERVRSVYPGESEPRVASTAGILFRFIYDMAIDDIVVYSSKLSRKIHVGQVIGTYSFDPDVASNFPHRRPVRWITSVAREAVLSQAREEIGASQALFLVTRTDVVWRQLVEVK